MLHLIQQDKSEVKCFLGIGKKNWLGVLVILALISIPLGSALAQDQKQPASKDDFDYSSQTLRVGVWMEGKEEGDVLQRGEKFTVGFQANQDAYAVVYRIDAEGRVAVLWPRSRFDDGFVFGGHEYLLPVSGARRLVASGETGEGFVEAVVSSYPFDLRDLELDFHHEFTDQPWNFQVTGDPFLAMNEVNYVVTGLEDSGDYVITNHLSYYVHQAVEHPRFLCGQCHFEEDVAYHPYQDTCTLDINYDYGWSNSWYDNYGYYPVYSNPVYVYVDPWTYRPWVNFWYDPWYTCAPSWGWGWGWGYNCYSWYNSPYYGGGCYDYYGNGNRRYGPLDRTYAAGGTKVKSREHSRVTGLIDKNGPSDRDRNAMKTRTSLTDARRSGSVTTAARTGEARSADARFRGTERAARTRPQIDSSSQLRSNSGLRIRNTTEVRSGGDSARPAVRHTAGGGTTRATLTPVRRASTGPDRTGTTVRSNNPAPTQNRADKPATSRVRSNNSSSNSRTIKPVEPRKKGTRVWNTRPESQSQGRSGRSPSVNTNNRTRQPSVTPRTNSGSKQGRSGTKATSKSSSRSSSKSKSSVKSSGGSKSSGGTRGSSSGGSRGGGSSGGSRGGSSSGGSRGGSSGRR